MIVGLRARCVIVCLCVFLSGCGTSLSAATPTPPASAPAAVSTVPVVQSSPVPKGKFSVGLVTDVGGLGDRSFNDLAWKAVKATRRLYNARASVIQSSTEASYVPNLTALAKKHLSVIVAIGASMAAAVYNVAGTFPRQRFVLVDARPMSSPGREVAVENVADVLFNEADAGYEAGVVAGSIERRHVGQATHNTIGYVGAYAIPDIVRYLAGYVAGARTVDPTVKVIDKFSGTYVDAKTGKTIALDQIRRGADVLFQVAALTGTGYLQAANARGVFGIGSDVDQSYIGADVVTSALKRVDVALGAILRDDELGRFRPGDNLFGAANGGTGLAPLSASLPASIKSEVDKYASRLASGRVTPPSAIPAG